MFPRLKAWAIFLTHQGQDFLVTNLKKNCCILQNWHIHLAKALSYPSQWGHGGRIPVAMVADGIANGGETSIVETFLGT